MNLITRIEEQFIAVFLKGKLSNFDDDPIKTIRDSYNECVIGITKTLKRHLKSMLPDDSESIKLLFEEKIEGMTLYDLRHEIAHGGLDLLTEKQVERINKRLFDAEKIARNYILQVLKKSLNVEFRHPTKMVFLLLPENALSISG